MIPATHVSYMRRLLIWGAAIASLMVSVSSSRAQDPLDDLQPIPYQVGTVTDQSDPRWNKPRMGLTVAKVLEPAELRNYALTLHLSAAQRAAVRDAYLAYRAKIDKLNAEYQEPLASLSTEAADTQAHPYDLEYLRLCTELRDLESRYQRELVTYDKALLTDIQEVLAEPQQPLFERVALRRARKRCQPYTIDISPGYIDFVELVEKYVTDTDVLGDLDPLLLEYERLITPLYLQIDESARAKEMDDTRGMVMHKYAADGKTLLAAGSPEAIASAQAYLDQRPEILGRTIPQQERLADINRQYIEKLKAAIPSEQFAPLWQEYLRQSFPYIHPDQCAPTGLMQSMLEVEGLDPDLRTMMQARMDTWRSAYDAMTRDMEDHYIAYNKYFARNFSSEGEHTPIIRKLRFDRWTLSEEAVKSLHGMLPAEIKASFDARARAFEKRLAAERERETNPRRGNP